MKNRFIHLLHSLTISLFLVLGSWFYSSAQWVPIPDNKFGTWLSSNGYWQCLQGNNTVGWQLDTTCNNVTSYTTMDCSMELISNLEGIQYFNSLQDLDCSGNSLTSLPTLPSTLRTLGCINNNLTSLPALPSSLVVLACYSNDLDSLPPLPNSLTTLRCFFNQLSSLPPLPNSLLELHCNSNQIDSMPALPNSLRNFNCGGNQLTSMPALPDSLVLFYCGNNQLTGFPTLPKSINEFWCNNNQLTSLPPLPDSLAVFYCYNNPNLTCLPQLKKVVDLRFYNTSITCLPNFPQSNTTSNPALDTVPVCNMYNSSACPAYLNITGNAYYDFIPNCSYNNTEPIGSNLKIQLYNAGNLVQEVFTNGDGSYSLDINDFGSYSYSIDSSSIPFSVNCPSTGFRTSVITALDSMDFNMDFGLRCKNGFDLGARSIATPTIFRPANFTQVNITAGDASNFYNAHCAAGTSGAVTVTINGSAHYTAPASGALTPTINGNTLTYNIADFGAVDFFTAFNIVVQTDTTAVLGSQICITVSVTPTAGDNNPANNTLTICFPVVGSFDPNDKTAYPAGDIDTAQKEITYTVRFQNTGTAEAQHIYIADTLDTDIDEGSFQLLAYSHQPMVQIEQNRVRFNFPNINLPDSNTNEPLSHGYVQYKVKLKDNLPIGTQINNTAHIYFDFNAPVVTNTTSNTITTNTTVSLSPFIEWVGVRIFPNPASGSFTVSVSENLIGETLTVTDITGKQMMAVQLGTQNSAFSTANFASGVYLVKVGNTVKKLIVQR